MLQPGQYPGQVYGRPTNALPLTHPPLLLTASNAAPTSQRSHLSWDPCCGPASYHGMSSNPLNGPQPSTSVGLEPLASQGEDIASQSEAQSTYGVYYTDPWEPSYAEPVEPPPHFGEEDFGEDVDIYHVGLSPKEPASCLTAIKQKGRPGRLSCCKCCQQDFKSSNKLHQHLQGKCQQGPSRDSPEPEVHNDLITTPSELPIVESTSNARPDIGMGLGFCGWHYIMIGIQFSPLATPKQVCLDSGCSITLMDASWI